MLKFHLLYTWQGALYNEYRQFESFEDAEKWLEHIGASNWEIAQC